MTLAKISFLFLKDIGKHLSNKINENKIEYIYKYMRTNKHNKVTITGSMAFLYAGPKI